MKFCQPHWDQLRKAIEDHGLSRFVSQGGKMAMEREVEQLEGKADPTKPYDPLMSAHWGITSRVLEGVGLWLLSPPEKCPLCVVNENCKDCKCGKPQEAHAQEYIDWAADGIRADFIEKGWLKKEATQ